jgi:hypothetical protein
MKSNAKKLNAVFLLNGFFSTSKARHVTIQGKDDKSKPSIAPYTSPLQKINQPK